MDQPIPPAGTRPVERPSGQPPAVARPGTPPGQGPGMVPAPGPRPDPSVVPVAEMPQPRVAGGAAMAAEMERPHPLTPLAQGWIGFVTIVFVFGRNALEHPSEYLHAHWWIWALFGGYLLLSVGAGFLVWRTTRFVVTDTELRIERNFVQHRSDRIPFTKIQGVDVQQPFAARLMGLASVRVDVGSGRGRRVEYLSRTRAQAMRDYLVARAHGVQVTVEQSASLPASDAWNDRAVSDRPIVRADPGRLILAAVTSHQFLLGAIAPFVVTIIVFAATSEPLGVFVGSAMPWLLAGFGVISHHVVGQWNYTLSHARQGLRITRGMASLTSESIPVDRVQALVIRQSLLWRPLGIHRMQVDVLGHAFSEGSGSDVSTGNLLVPAGSWADVVAATQAIWPGTDLAALQWRQVSRRGRWLAPFTWGSQQWAVTDAGPVSPVPLAASRGGLLEHRTTLVPHARVQSVSLHQGVLHRLLGVATVSLHTCAGLARFRRTLLDPVTAREFALTELDRCREARRIAPAPHWLPPTMPVPSSAAAAMVPAAPSFRGLSTDSGSGASFVAAATPAEAHRTPPIDGRPEGDPWLPPASGTRLDGDEPRSPRPEGDDEPQQHDPRS